VTRGLSEHAPLVIDHAPSRKPVERHWDCDTVPAEFQRLLGVEARQVVERLIAGPTRRSAATLSRSPIITSKPTMSQTPQ
jgi:hypothetical protein